MKRSELLKMSEDAIKNIKLPFKMKAEKKRLEAWIIDYEEKVATLEAEIEEDYAAEELNVEKILDKIDRKELAERRLKQGQELMKRLYV